MSWLAQIAVLIGLLLLIAFLAHGAIEHSTVYEHVH